MIDLLSKAQIPLDWRLDRLDVITNDLVTRLDHKTLVFERHAELGAPLHCAHVVFHVLKRVHTLPIRYQRTFVIVSSARATKHTKED